MAERGYAISAVELGSNLSRLTAANLGPFPNATVVCADFERWDVEPNAYDLVVSAQAFHWIEPTVGYRNAHAALRSSGCLALVWNLFPGSEAPVYRAVDKVYRACAPQLCTAPGRRSLEEHVERTLREIRTSGLFGEPTVQRYPWTATTTSAEYLELLRTISDHLASILRILSGSLPPSDRRSIDPMERSNGRSWRHSSSFVQNRRREASICE